MSFVSFLGGETDVSHHHKPPFHKSPALAVTLGQWLPKAELKTNQTNCFAGRFRKESGVESQRLNTFPHTAACLLPAQKAGDSMGKSCSNTAFSAGNQHLQDCQFNWRRALESLLRFVSDMVSSINPISSVKAHSLDTFASINLIF